MTKGPRHRVAMKRRREGKTNYHRRLKLILSGKNRLVIRASLKNIIVQVTNSKIDGDIILTSAYATQLEKAYGWKFNSGNLPSAYLTGYLCGIRAKKAGIEEAILDIGILIHKHRIYAAFKGFIDSGVKVPHDDKIFNKLDLKNRITGEHIKNYAEILSKKDKDLYAKEFSTYIKNKVDPKKIPVEFAKIKKEIEKKS